jgi:hypothetical protein
MLAITILAIVIEVITIAIIIEVIRATIIAISPVHLMLI